MKKSIIAIVMAACLLPMNGTAQERSATWCPDNGDGTYTNPVINADYSDPDVCVGRSGEDFYMTASSFNCTPGLPILHSKDLVNWQIVNHAVPAVEPLERYAVPQHGNGVWAPSIRYNRYNDTYYIYWGDPDLGVFVTKTKDPEGEWSKPELIIKAKGIIDPTPLWDEDGRCYLVYAWANSRAGFNSVLTVREMTADGMSGKGMPRIVYDGNGTRNHTSEGPKFYKRDGWYWILCPAGGVEQGQQLAMRSRSPWGPYECKTVLARGTTNINGPHQGALVELKSGESWFVHFQDKEAYGRVIWLEPVTWTDGWPVMGEKPGVKLDGKAEKYCGQPVLRYRKPNVGKEWPVVNPQESDEFDGGRIGPQWQWHANYDETFGMPLGNDMFRLFTHRKSSAEANLWEAGNLLLQKTPADNFTATTKVRFTAKFPEQYGGLIVMGLDYSSLVVKRVGDSFELQQITCMDAEHGGKETATTLASLPVIKSNVLNGELALQTEVYLRLKVEYIGGLNDKGENKHEARVSFAYSTDGKRFKTAGTSFTMREGKWIGAKIGLCAAEPKGLRTKGYMDIDWFRTGTIPGKLK